MLAISRGLDRDRVVDETGSQTVVFGRRGSRPFHLDEMKPFLQHQDGSPLRVQDVKATNGKVVTKAGTPVAEPEQPKVIPAPSPDASLSQPALFDSAGAALPPIEVAPAR